MAKPINSNARPVMPRLENLARVSTVGVGVKVLKGPYACPQCDGLGRVTLPAWLFEAGNEDLLARSWRHELQHARDVLDGIDLPREEMEVRARRAELG
jgi:hypothetical protein